MFFHLVEQNTEQRVQNDQSTKKEQPREQPVCSLGRFLLWSMGPLRRKRRRNKPIRIRRPFSGRVVGAVAHRRIVGAVVVAGCGPGVRWRSGGCGRGSVVACFLQTALDGELQQLFIGQVTVHRIIFQGRSGSWGSRRGGAG